MFFSAVLLSALMLRPPMQPPPPAPIMKSPIEMMEEQSRLREQALRNRAQLGLPDVSREDVRIVTSPFALRHEPVLNYAKQSCYHASSNLEPENFVFCNASTCTFPDSSVCENATGDCFAADGSLWLTKDGRSTPPYKDHSVRWDMCLSADGAPVIPAGGQSFGERIKTGCGYRVGKPSALYTGMEGYVVACEKDRCLFHPSTMTYNRATGLFTNPYGGPPIKTPPYEYYQFLNWTCVTPAQMRRVPRKYRCSIVVEDEKNWGCEVCFENGKQVYRGCKYTYDDGGNPVSKIINISDALQTQLDGLVWLRDKRFNEKNTAVVKKISDLERYFNVTTVSAARQEAAAAQLEEFFERYDNAWSDARLGQELTALRKKIIR